MIIIDVHLFFVIYDACSCKTQWVADFQNQEMCQTCDCKSSIFKHWIFEFNCFSIMQFFVHINIFENSWINVCIYFIIVQCGCRYCTWLVNAPLSGRYFSAARKLEETLPRCTLASFWLANVTAVIGLHGPVTLVISIGLAAWL